MSLAELLGPPRPRPKCRNCDQGPCAPGALYCELCLDDMMSLVRMAQRRKHPAECFCVDCMSIHQRQFRHNQALTRKARESQPEPPDPFGPRRA